MRVKHAALSAVLGLIMAACGGPGTDGATETTDDTAEETTTTIAESPEEILLSYSLTAGDTFVYEVDISQNLEMSSEGEGGTFADEEPPGSASVLLTAKGTFTYEVADGSEAGTYAVTITSDLSGVTASGTIDGEPLDTDEVPEFAELEPVSMTVIVDGQGNVLPEDPDLGDPFAGLFGGLGDLGAGAVPGTQMGQFFGPPLLDEEVTVGDTWSTSFDTPGFGTEPFTTSVTSTVTESDVVDGLDVLVVESDVAIEPFVFDLGEFFVGMFSGFLPEDPSEEEQAELDALIDNLRFVISFDESGSHSTTYFDAAAGVTRQFEVESSSAFSMDMNFPDEVTGVLAGFTMDLTIDQTIIHHLLSGPSA